ncbi:MAG: MATE family efflux transporter, partial [Pseudomonadota bacterium]
VYQFNMGASGVALGTAFSEAFGFALSGAFSLYLMRHGGGVGQHFSVAKIVERSALARTLVVNRDIFIRTLLLSISFAWFTQRSGTFGDTTLAANQILLQLFLFTGLALDGTAIAAETLIGQATGTNDGRDYKRQIMSAIKATSMPALFLAVVFCLIYWFFGHNLTGALTKDTAISAESVRFLPWVIVSPLVLVGAFQLDGIFIGATRSKEMRNAMITCVLFFIPASLLLSNQFGNHGLWAAFTGYFILRAVSLLYYIPRIVTRPA